MEKQNDNWRIWDKKKDYGELLQQRATGAQEEMESSKALCEVLKPLYQHGMKVLDVGCGAGHYLRSLRLRVDEKMDYTGVDATEYYIELAKQAFQSSSTFMKADIYKLPFADNSFDIVTCNNLILHLPPHPVQPISELLRVAARHIIIRTVFGERNYVIQEVREPQGNSTSAAEEVDYFTTQDGPVFFNYFNMYTEQYFRSLISRIDTTYTVSVLKDESWQPFDNTRYAGRTATRAMDSNQVSGNLLLDWRFIVISNTKP